MDAESVRVTLSMTAAERDMLRSIAKACGTTVSGLIQAWVDTYCDAIPAITDDGIDTDVRQQMDGLTLLGSLEDGIAACAFIDPEYRGVLDHLRYGNEGRRQSARATIMWAGTVAHNDIAGCGRSLSPEVRAGGWESHALEHELSAHFVEVTHGAGLAVLLPAWMRYVYKADPARFLLFARDVFGIEADADAEDSAQAETQAIEAAIDQLQAFFQSLGMPKSLADFGIDETDIEAMVTTLRQNKGERFGAFMSLTMDDARAIYRSAL